MILAGIFRNLEQKGFLKLGWFTSSFAEITDEKSTEPESPRCGIRFRTIIYPLNRGKSSTVSAFFRISYEIED